MLNQFIHQLSTSKCKNTTIDKRIQSHRHRRHCHPHTNPIRIRSPSDHIRQCICQYSTAFMASLFLCMNQAAASEALISESPQLSLHQDAPGLQHPAELAPTGSVRTQPTAAKQQQVSCTMKVQGRPDRIIDGDTVIVQDKRIRLSGIDAPELKQPCLAANGNPYSCGVTARKALARKIGHHSVQCCLDSKDIYNRYLGYCFLENTTQTLDSSLNAWMVRTGNSLAYRQYSKAFVPQESWARQHNKGIWKGSFENPWDWRHNSSSHRY